MPVVRLHFLSNNLSLEIPLIELQYPVTTMTEAASRLLYPEKYSRPKPENVADPVILPDSFSHFVGKYPELTPFLIGQAKANPANFMHMVMVGDVCLGMGQDVMLLFPNKQRRIFRPALEHRLTFAFTHDNGKVFVGRDFDRSHNLVHPSDICARASEDNGWHWAHPAFGAYVLRSLALAAPDRLRRPLAWWSQQTAIHHREFIPFATELTSTSLRTFRSVDWMAHFLFTICDVSVAMRMERPGGNGAYDTQAILDVLQHGHLSDNSIRLFMPPEIEPDFARDYLTQSLFSHLDAVRARYSPADCVSPEGFVANGFWVNCHTDSAEVEQLARFSRTLWQAHERELLQPVERMDRAGVLQLR